MKKMILLAFLALFLTGCLNEGVSFEYIDMTEQFENITNTSTPHTIKFIAKNTAFSEADCKAELSIVNNGVSGKKTYRIEKIPARSEKQIQLNFDMPFGVTEFNLSPDCEFNE